LAQTINENEEFKNQMTAELERLEKVLDKHTAAIKTEHVKKMKFIQKKVADTSLAIDDLKQEQNKTRRVLHIVPHSHTDDLSSDKELQRKLGEISSEEMYEKGVPSNFVGTVNDILNTMKDELVADGNRTFTFGDLKFFKQWYDTLN